jgi:hypothetical protein
MHTSPFGALGVAVVATPKFGVSLKVKKKSLMFCATVVGFPRRFVSVTVIVPAPVVTVAVAFTGCPVLSVAPVGVENVIVDPKADAAAIRVSSGIDRVTKC